MKTVRLGALLFLVLMMTIPALAAEPVVITRQPDFAYAVPLGESVTVSLEAQGEGLVYNWYRKNPEDAEFVLDEHCTDNSYELVAEQWGTQLYCIITDSQGNQAFSDPVSITQPLEKLCITQQPESIAVPAGETAWVYSAISSGGVCAFTWYEKDPGAEEFTLSACTGGAYSVVMTPGVDGRQVYYEVTDDQGGWAVSDVATLTMAGGAAPALPEYEAPFLGRWKLVQLTKGTDVAEGDGVSYMVVVLSSGGGAIIDDGEVIRETAWQAQEASARMDGAVLALEEKALLIRYDDGAQLRFEPYAGELSLRAALPGELPGCWKSQQGETLEFWTSGAASSQYEDGAAALHLWMDQDGEARLLNGMHQETALYINQNNALCKNGELFRRIADSTAYQSAHRFTAEDTQRLQAFSLAVASGDAQWPEDAADCANADELLHLLISQ